MHYIIANWKMNLPNEAIEYYLSRLEKCKFRDLKIIIAPPMPFLSSFASRYHLTFSAQNICEVPSESGAFTGAISSLLIKKAGAEYAILGHSERRKYFSETDNSVKSKSIKALENGLTPIICIGESREERENNLWKDVLRMQIINSIQNTDQEIIIAYEPIWAIGTGLVPNIEEITETIDFIKGIISNIAKRVKIVYGGSVSEKNASVISKVPNLSGLLVGGASLKIEEFIKIIESYA